MVWKHLITQRKVILICLLCGIINCCNLLRIQNSERFLSSLQHNQSSQAPPESHQSETKSIVSDHSSEDAASNVANLTGSSIPRHLRSLAALTKNQSDVNPGIIPKNMTLESNVPVLARNLSRAESVAQLVLSHRMPYGLEDRPSIGTQEYKINSSLPTWKQMLETKRAAAARLGNSQLSLPRPPVKVLQFRNETKLDSTKPVLTILAATRSYPNQKTTATTNLQQRLMPSLSKTISTEEQKLWSIQLWIAVDDSDSWWLNHWHELQNVPDWMDVFFAVFPDELHRIPFNEVAYLAYNVSRPDYLCRVNDDSAFLSSSWITLAAETLVKLNPPNIGVVGPSCKEGNKQILTHDFVHASHMEIFDGVYYPQVFKNWYLDDFISVVYSEQVLGQKFHRVFQPKDWLVKHWLSQKRYVSTTVDSQWLPFEYEIGRRKIKNFVEEKFPALDSLIPTSMPDPKDMTTLNAIREFLRSDGNLLVWGMDFEESPALHRLSSERVLFLEDSFRPQPNQTAKSKCPHAYHILGKFPYLQFEPVLYTTTLAKVKEVGFEVLGNATENKTQESFCNFNIPLFPKHTEETSWDVVYVDAKRSSNEHNSSWPMQAVFMTLYLLAKQKTDRPRYLLVRGYFSADAISRRIFEKLLDRQPDQTLLEEDIALFIFNSEDEIKDPSSGCPKPVLRVPKYFGGRWSLAQVQAVLDVLPIDGNLIVFGIQNDPRFWDVSSRGHVHFIENEALRATNGRYAISTLLEQYPNLNIQRQRIAVRNNPAGLSRALNDLNQTQTVAIPYEGFSGIAWNVILVSCMEQAMFQSLVDARHVLRQAFADGSPIVHVFVEHYEREPVANFAESVFLQSPFAIHERIERRKGFRLAHFVIKATNHTENAKGSPF